MTISATTQGIKPGVCTSTNRPSAPFDGQVIYMTDVDQTAVWDGTQWTVLAPIAGGRNMIINGAMQVDQRNSGASYTMANAGYGLDRWKGLSSAANKYSVQRLTTTPPAGFSHYQRVTSLAATADTAGAYYTLYQVVEGFNATRLSWGTASAKSVSLSFWVRSSLTGTFGGGLRNNGGTGGFYSYAFTYTINAANTWEYKTISITGSTAGTWGLINDAGINIFFDLGCNSSETQAAGSWANVNRLAANGCVRLIGTNAATLDITGIQFEAGAVATPFEFEDYQVTLAKCQRYYWRANAANGAGVYYMFGIGQGDTTTNVEANVILPVVMRTAPTAIETTATASNYAVYSGTVISACTSLPLIGTSNSSPQLMGISFRSTGAVIVGRAYQIIANANNTAYLGFSAEL